MKNHQTPPPYPDSASQDQVPIETRIQEILALKPTQEEEDQMIARVLATVRTIALVVDSLGESYQYSLMKGVCSAAELLGVNVVVCAGYQFRAPAAIREWVAGRAFEGVILASGTLRLSAVDIIRLRGALCEDGFTGTLVSVGVAAEGIPSFVIDDEALMRTLVDHYLREHPGRCTRIGYIGGPDDNEEARRRLDGFQRAVGEHYDAQLVVRGDFLMDSGEALARKLLQRASDIQVIICANDLMARGAQRAIAELGRSVLVSGFDNSIEGRVGQFTTVEQDPGALGQQAVQAIDSKTYEGPATLPARLVIGHRCGCQDTQGAKRAADLPRLFMKWLGSGVQAFPARPLVRAFLQSMKRRNPRVFVGYVADVLGRAGYDELGNWRHLLSELRRSIEQQTIDPVQGYTALRLLAEANDLLFLAEERILLELRVREQRLAEITRRLTAAGSTDEIWEIVKTEFPKLIDRFYVCRQIPGNPGSSEIIVAHDSAPADTRSFPTRDLLPGERLIAMQPWQLTCSPISLGEDHNGYAVMRIDGRTSWVTAQALFDRLCRSLTKVIEKRRLQTAERALGAANGWGDSQRTRLSWAARFVKESLSCDIVVIYPLLGDTFRVQDIGPAIAGDIWFQSEMLSRVHPGDVVSRLLKYGQSIYINETRGRYQHESWFKRKDRLGFQEREGIRSLSGHILQWGADKQIEGVMFCNYRRPVDVERSAPFAESIALHAALAIHQEKERVIWLQSAA